MRFSTAIGTIMVLTSSVTGFTLQPRAANIDPRDCPGKSKAAFDALNVEFERARKIISYGSQNLKSGDDFSEFATAFFGPEKLGSSLKNINQRYNTMKKLATDKSGNDINVRCAKRCAKGTNAYMKISLLKEEMILCPPFWEFPSIDEVIDHCKQRDITLQNVKETRARVLVHELAHSKRVSNPIITDYVYEIPNLVLLAKGEYVQVNKKGERKTLDRNLVTKNAETYALTVAGIWAEEKCQKERAGARVHIGDTGSQVEETESEAGDGD